LSVEGARLQGNVGLSNDLHFKDLALETTLNSRWCSPRYLFSVNLSGNLFVDPYVLLASKHPVAINSTV